MWDTIDTNKTIGLLCPNDPDGNALADADHRLPGRCRCRGGYTVVDPGRFAVPSTTTSRASSASSRTRASRSWSASRSRPTSRTFWTQAKQQDFNPKLVTMAKAVLFSSAVEALGDVGDGLASEIWWTPTHPFTQLADRRVRRKSCRTSTRRPPASSGRSSSASSTRCSRSAFDVAGPRRRHRQAGHRRRRRGHRPRHHRRAVALRRRRRAEERLPDVARRRSVAEDRTAASSRSTWWSPTTACRRRSRSAATLKPLGLSTVAATGDGTARSRRHLEAVRRLPGDRQRSRSTLPRAKPSASSGPNGAGKTTLLNLVAGDLRPDSRHRARSAGVDISRQSAHARCRPRHRAHGADPATVRGAHACSRTCSSAARSARVGPAARHRPRRRRSRRCERTGMLDKANVIAGAR